MNSKYLYEQNQRVYFNLDGKIKGWARICGATTDDLPAVGRCWIIEPEPPTPFDKNVYPFTHISAFSCQLDLTEFEIGKNAWNSKSNETETKKETA